MYHLFHTPEPYHSKFEGQDPKKGYDLIGSGHFGYAWLAMAAILSKGRNLCTDVVLVEFHTFGLVLPGRPKAFLLIVFILNRDLVG